MWQILKMAQNRISGMAARNITGSLPRAGSISAGIGGIRTASKFERILSALEAANGTQEMALPMFRFHPLTGDRRGTYAVTVKANWRVTCRFHEGAAYDVELEDYH